MTRRMTADVVGDEKGRLRQASVLARSLQYRRKFTQHRQEQLADLQKM